MKILMILVLGAVVGWIAGLLVKGRGFGVVGNLIVGIVGALLGGFIFDLAGISSDGGLLGTLVTALVGAVVLLFLIGLLKKST